MAKKVVATFKAKVKVNYTKVIRTIKNDKGSYSFKEEMMETDKVRSFLDRKCKIKNIRKTYIRDVSLISHTL